MYAELGTSLLMLFRHAPLKEQVRIKVFKPGTPLTLNPKPQPQALNPKP